jgi:hypothetical protein
LLEIPSKLGLLSENQKKTKDKSNVKQAKLGPSLQNDIFVPGKIHT